VPRSPSRLVPRRAQCPLTAWHCWPCCWWWCCCMALDGRQVMIERTTRPPGMSASGEYPWCTAVLHQNCTVVITQYRCRAHTHSASSPLHSRALVALLWHAHCGVHSSHCGMCTVYGPGTDRR
jgi:hypothetical protein